MIRRDFFGRLLSAVAAVFGWRTGAKSDPKLEDVVKWARGAPGVSVTYIVNVDANGRNQIHIVENTTEMERGQAFPEKVIFTVPRTSDRPSRMMSESQI